MYEEEDEKIEEFVMDNFEYITDATDKIDLLIEDAQKTKNKKEKKEKLKKAQSWIDIYEKYIGRKVYTSII